MEKKNFTEMVAFDFSNLNAGDNNLCFMPPCDCECDGCEIPECEAGIDGNPL